MNKQDIAMSNKNLHCLIVTNFGAILDLTLAENDKLSVNKHVVIVMFFVCTN